MHFFALLSLLPLIATASPAPKPAAAAHAYNPFFPADFKYDTSHTLDKRQAVSQAELNSRAEIERAGLAQMATAQSNQKRHVRNPGSMRKIRRSTNGRRKRGTCPVNTTSAAASATSAAATASTTFIGGGAVVIPSSSAAASSAAATSSAVATTTSSASTPAETAYTVDPAGNGPFSGWGTYFDVGLSACGTYDTPGMPIVAVSAELFDSWPGYDGTNPNNNPICGQHLDITWGGKTLTVEVTDRCPGCAVRSLDLSKGAFHFFADYSVGLLGMDSYTGNITWSWTEGTGRLPTLSY